MKPRPPHPLFHFEDDFTPRPKLISQRRFNWPLLVFLLINAAVVLGVLIFIYVMWTR